ncbi:hypothetical protein [Niallia nealsonii]|uniref:Yip1 domain-containing protein n=1 Tax=Niallia nealsonii TaxID=115979 RepID=A0A2N0YXH5_9BACI|nr:hypothetical protein [Niallia nealsonii]PKG21962.1 hypothetical protein CWS01_19600 [Niallia nealsonii]
MDFYARIIRGLKEINTVSYELQTAEKMTGLFKKIIYLFLIATIVFAISSLLGIGNEMVSKELIEYDRSDFELNKLLFASGQVIWGWVFFSLHLFLVSLYFYVFSDVDYHKLLYIQVLAMTILLIEKIVIIPMQIYFGLPPLSSIFSLGIMAQTITSKKIIHYFLAEISLFKIWMIYIQYKYLTVISGKSGRYIIMVVLGIYLIILIISALTAYWHLENLV